MISTRKMKLTIVNDDGNESYQYIRDSMYAQYQGLNMCAGYLASEYFACGRDIKSERFKEAQKQLKNSSDFFSDIQFGKGIDSKSMITQKVKKDFSAALKNGLAKGERSFMNYKRTFPLMTRGRDLMFYEEDGHYYIKWVHKIVFKVVLGVKNDKELLHTLNKIVHKEYSIMQSSIAFDKKNHLILNITLDIPKVVSRSVVPKRFVGVDLGIAIPAYVSVSDNDYIKKGIGSADDFIRIRTRLNKTREHEYKKMKLANGGHGRETKLRSLAKFKEREKNFVRTYNHFVSKEIVTFALKYKAEAIKLEDLTKEGFENRLLRNWSYYQLQEMIEYKAKREGLKVLYVNPAYTSQTCSKCGYVDKENRVSQSKFICKKCSYEANADYNASRNIAMSENVMK